MKTQELRLGNLVHHKILDKTVKITALDVYGNVKYFDGKTDNETIISAIEPIPLTKEILKDKFKDYCPPTWDDLNIVVLPNNVVCKIRDGKPELTQLKRGEWYHIGENENFFICCQYVHQLQDLYKAITGEELEIEL